MSNVRVAKETSYRNLYWFFDDVYRGVNGKQNKKTINWVVQPFREAMN